MQHANLTSERLRRHRWLSAVATAALIANAAMPITHASADDSATASPIKHVIIIIGENRTFDHVFATYKPVSGEKVLNLLSRESSRRTGHRAPTTARPCNIGRTISTSYQLNPPKTPYVVLPPALVGGPSVPYVCAASGYAGVTCVRE